MTKCLICGKELKSSRALAGHVGAGHRMSMEEYTLKYVLDGVRPGCKECGNETKFIRGKNIYREYCSDHANLSRSRWSKENGYGAKVDAGWKKGLTKETNKSIAAQAEKMKGEGNSIHKMSDNALRGMREKQRETRIERDNYKLTEERFERSRKRIESRLSLVFVDGFEKYDGPRSKFKIICRRCGEESVKAYVDMRDGQACPICANGEVAKKLKITKEQFEVDKGVIKERLGLRILGDYSTYKNNRTVYDVRCDKCDKEYPAIFYRLKEGRSCKYCAKAGTSKAEGEIFEFVSSLIPAEQGSRAIITPSEIDIFIPSKNIGIEYHGLYWHSELQKSDKRYHIKKWEMCKKKGVQLIQIIEDQWRDKPEIVKSMIRSRLGMIENRMFARKTEIRVLSSVGDKRLMKDFFNQNHLDGTTPSKVGIGLFHDGELVSCLSLRRPFTKMLSEKGNIEIARFASLKNVVVVGGFGKILKSTLQWVRDNEYSKVITYADLKFGSGDVYLKNGFSFIGNSLGEYWYTDLRIRENRFKYKARKSSDPEGKMSEKEYAELCGVVRIYGVGSAKYEMEI